MGLPVRMIGFGVALGLIITVCLAAQAAALPCTQTNPFCLLCLTMQIFGQSGQSEGLDGHGIHGEAVSLTAYPEERRVEASAPPGQASSWRSGAPSMMSEGEIRRLVDGEGAQADGEGADLGAAGTLNDTCASAGHPPSDFFKYCNSDNLGKISSCYATQSQTKERVGKKKVEQKKAEAKRNEHQFKATVKAKARRLNMKRHDLRKARRKESEKYKKKSLSSSEINVKSFQQISDDITALHLKKEENVQQGFLVRAQVKKHFEGHEMAQKSEGKWIPGNQGAASSAKTVFVRFPCHKPFTLTACVLLTILVQNVPGWR